MVTKAMMIFTILLDLADAANDGASAMRESIEVKEHLWIALPLS